MDIANHGDSTPWIGGVFDPLSGITFQGDCHSRSRGSMKNTQVTINNLIVGLSIVSHRFRDRPIGLAKYWPICKFFYQPVFGALVKVDPSKGEYL